MKVLAILQARCSSTRLPNKVLKTILSKAMIHHQIDRINRSKYIDQLIVATSTDESDSKLVDLCEKIDVNIFRGSLNNVLDRFYQAALYHNADIIVRLTGDCPLIDPSVIDGVIKQHLEENNDYTSNIEPATFPDGLDVEVFNLTVLQNAWGNAKSPSELEHVTPFIRSDKSIQKGSYIAEVDNSDLRWTVDEPNDLTFVTAIYELLGSHGDYFNSQEIYTLLKSRPDLMNINNNIERNEGYAKSLEEDKQMIRYKNSNEMLERALKTIPLASQTFSKSMAQFPVGSSPLFIEKGKGSKVWDVDGNEYIDFMNGLLSVSIGYGDEDVSKAVYEQIQNGVSFSLPHRLEMIVAEKLVSMVPCAEKVRFGKNGTDATSAAIRLARAYTKKDMVLVCGYHGWQDWYIGSTTRSLGVPESTQALTKVFKYNDIDSLSELVEKYQGKIAAIIMEPMNVEYPKEGYLQNVQKIAKKENIVFIFDETITGCRFAKGGAQEYFGVTPDLATFGKGIGNGFPLSAIVGKKEIMDLMEDIFFSGTFGGETASLAAANVVLEKIDTLNIPHALAITGTILLDKLNILIKKLGCDNFLSTAGHPAWSFLVITDTDGYSSFEIKTLFMQEMLKRGILTFGTHNISYSHTLEDINFLMNCYEEVLPILKESIKSHVLLDKLNCQPLKPLFKVR